MPTFHYMARDRHGLLQTGHLDAVGEDAVVAILQNRGLIVTALTHRGGGAGPRAYARATRRRLRARVTTYDQVLFCQELATLLDAGIPLVKGLEVLGAQVESRPLLLAIEQMRQDIEAGLTFRDAMAKHPKMFSNFWVHLVETGEASGHLAQALQQLGTYLESARTLQDKAITALTYPAVLIGAAILCTGIFVLKIIPVFTDIFASMNMKLPLLTQAIVTLGEFARRYVLLVAGATVVAVWAVRQFVRTEQGKWLVDQMVLRLPVFKRLFIGLQLAQFARGLATLLESGVPILYSLEITASSASNTVYGRAIAEVKDYVREGKPMAEPLMQSGLFPPMVIQMVQVGEEIGELGKMLDRIAKYYEGQVSTFIDRLSVLFEPLAIGVMGIVIGVLVVSMFLPIFTVAGTFGAGGAGIR